MDFKPDLFHMTMALLLVFLALLAYRLVRVLLKRSTKKTPEPRPERELLMNILHERAMGEKMAVADHQASAAALQAMQELHSHLIQHLPLGLAVVETHGRIAYLNPLAFEMLGPPGEGQSLRTWNTAVAEWFENHRLQQGRPEEQILVKRGAEQLTLRILLTPLPDACWMLTFQDRSKIVQLEEQVQLKRDLAFMGEVASGITHEVKNALALIQGHVQMLPYGEVKEHSGKIQEEINRLLDSVKQFMRSSKTSSLNMVAVNLEDLFLKLHGYWQDHEDSGKVVIDRPLAQGVLYGDLGQMMVVLNNLVLNGLQACRPANSETSWVKVWFQEQEHHWSIFVEDRGPGFSPDVLEKLFVPFVSTKEEGSGFGLFHCRRIMLQHQGRLEVLPGLPTKVVAFFPKELASPEV